MATELLRDKFANVKNQLDQVKLQLFLAEIQMAYEMSVDDGEDELTKAAKLNLKNESTGARANAITLRRKVEILQPIHDTLKAEIKAEDEKAAKPS